MPIPFGLANLAFAITNVNFITYILSSVVGLLPSQFLFCYVGSTLKSMSEVLANDSTTRTATVVFTIQLIIACFVMYYIFSAARIELQKHIDHDENINENNDRVREKDLNTKLELVEFNNKNQLLTV